MERHPMDPNAPHPVSDPNVLPANHGTAPLTPGQRPRQHAGRTLGLVGGALLVGAVAGGSAGAALTNHFMGVPGTAPAAIVVRQEAAGPLAATAAPVAPAAAHEQGYADLYQRVSPGVAFIAASSGGQGGGVGCGVVLDKQGHILTNFHVVDGSTSLTVHLSDGTEGSAKVLGTDPSGDMALIQADIPADKLTPLPLGDSDAMRPGDAVVAIGNPLGLENTITSGIVSAVGRTQSEGEGRPLRGLIQTDAAVNPGNSGGPLLNLNGEVVGINTLGLGRSGAQGINFAVPINAFKTVQDKLMAGATVEHPWLGISGRDVTPSNKSELGVTADHGVLVIEVLPSSPAAKAALQGSSGPEGDEKGG